MTIVSEISNRGTKQVREDLLFCASAARKDASKIGWIPHAAYTKAALRNNLILLTTNGDRVGYALYGVNTFTAELKLFQVWVRQDARLIVNGRLLVAKAEEVARRARAWRLRCWVAEDLAANLFWHAIGFKKKTWRDGPAKSSKRKQILWVRAVTFPGALPLNGPNEQPIH